MESQTSKKAETTQPDGNPNSNDQQQGQTGMPPPYSAYPQQVYSQLGYPSTTEPYRPSASAPGSTVVELMATTGPHAPPAPAAFPTFPNRQAAVRKIGCMKMMLTLGVAFLVAALAYYIKAQRYGDYDSNDDPASVDRIIPLVFMSVGLVFLLIGGVLVAVIYRGEQRLGAEGYATLASPITHSPNQPVHQGVPSVFSQLPLSTYPRQQYANHV